MVVLRRRMCSMPHGAQGSSESSSPAARRHSAYRETRTDGAITVVEGRDPDDLVVMLIYAGREMSPMRHLPARIYAW